MMFSARADQLMGKLRKAEKASIRWWRRIPPHAAAAKLQVAITRQHDRVRSALPWWRRPFSRVFNHVATGHEPRSPKTTIARTTITGCPSADVPGARRTSARTRAPPPRRSACARLGDSPCGDCQPPTSLRRGGVARPHRGRRRVGNIGALDPTMMERRVAQHRVHFVPADRVQPAVQFVRHS